MAIAYKEEALPPVSSFAFDINRWAGVNKIKGGQYDYEMADCVNMSSDNFPYASPRKPRECLYTEDGIKRIYKVEGDRIYFIDSDDKLAYAENGVKTILSYTDENGVEKYINASNCLCTNNYDRTSVFYPNMIYVDRNGNAVKINYPLKFSTLPEEPVLSSHDEFPDGRGWYYEVYCTAYITDTAQKNINIYMTLPESTSYAYPRGNSTEPASDDKFIPRIRVRVYNASGELKTHNQNSDYGEDCPYIECFAVVTQRMNTYTLTIPDEITLEEGDYIHLKVGLYHPYNDFSESAWEENMDYALKADWYIDDDFATLPLDYGVVYNNRIVGVKGSEIRASALGDFSNFYEYSDEAGNPSATGAYATNVGSAGDFTGICAYNNVLLLFKKDIVYEMYGSMPYTITELCNTGCIDNDSICSINGVLYWASTKGIVRYSGGVPVVISNQVDICTDGICKAGTDGRKYYVYDGHKTFVYDTYYQLWHIEDKNSVKMFYRNVNNLYVVYDDGIYKLNSGNEAVDWEFTTKDYTFSSKERKNLSKLWIRADMQKNSRLEIYVRQNCGEWSRVAVKTAQRDEMFDFKLRVKKCDSYSLKFKGYGNVKILDIHGKVTVGTSKHRSGSSLNVYRK